MIYKGHNFQFAITDLECKIVNLCPKSSAGIFKQIYNKMILIFVLNFLTVFIIFSVIANIL